MIYWVLAVSLALVLFLVSKRKRLNVATAKSASHGTATPSRSPDLRVDRILIENTLSILRPFTIVVAFYALLGVVAHLLADEHNRTMIRWLYSFERKSSLLRELLDALRPTALASFVILVILFLLGVSVALFEPSNRLQLPASRWYRYLSAFFAKYARTLGQIYTFGALMVSFTFFAPAIDSARRVVVLSIRLADEQQAKLVGGLSAFIKAEIENELLERVLATAPPLVQSERQKSKEFEPRLRGIQARDAEIRKSYGADPLDLREMLDRSSRREKVVSTVLEQVEQAPPEVVENPREARQDWLLSMSVEAVRAANRRLHVLTQEQSQRTAAIVELAERKKITARILAMAIKKAQSHTVEALFEEFPFGKYIYEILAKTLEGVITEATERRLVDPLVVKLGERFARQEVDLTSQAPIEVRKLLISVDDATLRDEWAKVVETRDAAEEESAKALDKLSADANRRSQEARARLTKERESLLELVEAEMARLRRQRAVYWSPWSPSSVSLMVTHTIQLNRLETISKVLPSTPVSLAGVDELKSLVAALRDGSSEAITTALESVLPDRPSSEYLPEVLPFEYRRARARLERKRASGELTEEDYRLARWVLSEQFRVDPRNPRSQGPDRWKSPNENSKFPKVRPSVPPRATHR